MDTLTNSQLLSLFNLNTDLLSIKAKKASLNKNKNKTLMQATGIKSLKLLILIIDNYNTTRNKRMVK